MQTVSGDWGASGRRCTTSGGGVLLIACFLFPPLVGQPSAGDERSISSEAIPFCFYPGPQMLRSSSSSPVIPNTQALVPLSQLEGTQPRDNYDYDYDYSPTRY